MGQVKGLLISIIIISGVVIGVSAFYSDVAVKYGVSSTNMAFLNRSTQIAQTLEGIEERTAAPTSEAESVSFLAFGAFNALKLTGDSIGIVSGLASDATNPEVTGATLPIPSWIGVVIMGILMVIVIFGLAVAWLKWDL